MKKLTVSELIKQITSLRAGEQILLSGTIYIARDAAHKRLTDLMQSNSPLPFDLQNAVIYYCGPCPAKPGDAIGPCGPTTSSRMDIYTPMLLSKGVKATIGKGPRSIQVIDAMKQNKSVYMVVTGGVAALLSKKVKKSEVIAFDDLGPEAVYKFEVEDFPLIIANDVYGNDIFRRR